jgi:hypothetical protein
VYANNVIRDGMLIGMKVGSLIGVAAMLWMLFPYKMVLNQKLLPTACEDVRNILLSSGFKYGEKTASHETFIEDKPKIFTWSESNITMFIRDKSNIVIVGPGFSMVKLWKKMLRLEKEREIQ